jgi:hypothetical protein
VLKRHKIALAAKIYTHKSGGIILGRFYGEITYSIKGLELSFGPAAFLRSDCFRRSDGDVSVLSRESILGNSRPRLNLCDFYFVCFGPIAAKAACLRHVRFTPESGHAPQICGFAAYRLSIAASAIVASAA